MWCRSAFNHVTLIYLNLAKLDLDRPTKITLVQPHILNRIDYCNVMYANSHKGDIKGLQKSVECSFKMYL